MSEKRRNFQLTESIEGAFQERLDQQDEAREWLELGLKDQELEQQAQIHHLAQEKLLNQQKIAALERCLTETQQNLSQIYTFNSDLLAQQAERFNQERGALLSKLEQL